MISLGRHHHGRRPTAFTLIETLVIVGVVSATIVLLLVATSRRSRTNCGASMKDKTQAMMIYKSMSLFAADNGSGLPQPSVIAAASTDQPDVRNDTTASLHSAMIAQNFYNPELCIGPTEPNPVIIEMKDYNYHSWKPGAGVFWDSNFKADLQTGGNASYAHMPLWGERLLRRWRSVSALDAAWPMLGSRGPRDGVRDPNSHTYKIAGTPGMWSGHVVFGDGHVETLTDVAPRKAGPSHADDVMNFFRFDGDEDADGILTFTKSMSVDGPVIQHD